MNKIDVHPPYYFIGTVGAMTHSRLARSYPYQLILAQMWLGSVDYQRAVISMKWELDRNQSYNIILDNGAHEGINISLEDYFTVVLQASPSCVVLPDLIGKSHIDSRIRSMLFAEQVLKLYPATKLMYVPQGRNRDEIVEEFEWAQNELDPNTYTIGFGQSYLTWETDEEKDEVARLRLVGTIMSHSNAYRARYHILGARWHPKSFANHFDKFHFVGLDTIKPCHCCLEGRMYPSKPPRKIDRMDKACPSDALLSANIQKLCDHYELSKDGLTPTSRLKCLHCRRHMLNHGHNWFCRTCRVTISKSPYAAATS